MARIAKKTKRYPSDLTDEEWVAVEPFLPKAGKTGSPRRPDSREVSNALRYLVRSGCEWRMLPTHFPPWPTVCSQSVKAPAAGGTCAFDGAKGIVGRKRHIAVDTDGRLLMVHLTTAHVSDSAGAQVILEAIRKRWPWIKHIFADGTYDRKQLMDKAAFLDVTVEVVRRTEPGFVVLPRRWAVERTFGWLTRTFGWLTRYRRLVRDHEARTDVSEAMIELAMAGLLIRRITR